MYINRAVEHEILELGKIFPVVAVLGPRQVGKSTLVSYIAKHINKPYIHLDLELPSDLQKISFPEIFFRHYQDHTIIIDEVQLKPGLFSVLRPLIDEDRQPFRFIITGSASPDLIRQSSESLAGRIAYVELTPFNRIELRKNFTLLDHHFLGGFPLAIIKGLKPGIIWLDQFLKTYIERDLPLLGFPANAQVTRRLWEMLAWQAGQLINHSETARSLGIDANTVKNYIYFLQNAYLIDLLQPFSVNIKKRLVKAPKVFFKDTGILHRLLQINNYDQLLGSHFLGSSWENYVYNQIKSSLDSGLSMYFYRTHAGAEIDIVITAGQEVLSCIEVKYADAPKLSRGFYNAVEDLKPKSSYVIIPNATEYFLGKDVTVCQLDLFLQNYLPRIMR